MVLDGLLFCVSGLLLCGSLLPFLYLLAELGVWFQLVEVQISEFFWLYTFKGHLSDLGGLVLMVVSALDVASVGS